MAAALTLNERCFLSAVRSILWQYKKASDELLIAKMEKRLDPACREIVCLLESAGCRLDNKVMTETLMTRVFQVLAEFMKDELHISVTLKSLLDCLSLAGPAIDKKFPYAAELGDLPWELVPNYQARTTPCFKKGADDPENPR